MLSFRFVPQHSEEFRFRQHGHAEGLCLGQLGACRRTGYDIGRFLGDRTAGLAAVLDDEGLCLIAGEALKGAGDDQRFARQLIPFRLALPRHVHARIGQTVDKVGGAVLGEELHHALTHHAAEAVDLADRFDVSFPDGFQRAEVLGQQGGGLVSDVADAKTEQQLVQIVLLGIFDGVEKVRCALLLELFQRQQLLEGQVIEVCAVPRPSMSMASREAKWMMLRRDWAGHSGLTQRRAASSSRWTTGAPQDGQTSGIW